MASVFYFLLLWIFPAVELQNVGKVTSPAPSFIEPSQTVTILFGGDVTFAYRFEQYVGTRLEYPFSEWHTIGHYDCMMVNLECPITFSDDSVKKNYVFRMHPRYLQLFKEARINVVNCANNHLGDFGQAGIVETLQWLNDAKIAHVGAGKNLEEARKPCILSIKGKKIGLIGYGSNGVDIAQHNRAGSVPISRAEMIRDVQALRNKVDFIVVNVHWGNEKAMYPTPQQVELGHALIDAGANVIVGHHSHVLQGVEEYNGGVICYSLGNFLFGGNANSGNSESALLRIVLNGKSWSYFLEPVSIVNWKVKSADVITAQRISQIIAERSARLNYLFTENTKGDLHE